MGFCSKKNPHSLWSLHFIWYRKSQNECKDPLYYHITSEIEYDWRKTKTVTVKANFIHSWSVECEFMHLAHFWKNWAIFGSFECSSKGSIWWQKNSPRCCLYCSTQKEPKITQFSKNVPAFGGSFCHQMLPLLDHSNEPKIAQFSKNVPNTL